MHGINIYFTTELSYTHKILLFNSRVTFSILSHHLLEFPGTGVNMTRLVCALVEFYIYTPVRVLL